MGDYPNFTEHNLRQELMLTRLHLDKLRPVYDAAMALWKSWCEGDALIESYSDDSAVLADAFDAACQKAEEVERG